MNKLELVEKNYLDGLNCCQSVIAIFSEEYGLPIEYGLKMASGFGGGLKRGEACGVVTGAIMALGLKYGNIDPLDNESKDKITDYTKKFQKRFIDEFGSVRCKDLLGYDVSIEEESRYAKENNISKQICPKYVVGAVKIIEEIMKD